MIPIGLLVTICVVAVIVVIGLWLDNKRLLKKETPTLEMLGEETPDEETSSEEEKDKETLSYEAKAKRRSPFKKLITIAQKVWGAICLIVRICRLLAHPELAKGEEGIMRLIPFFLAEKKLVVKALVLIGLTAFLTLTFGILVRTLPSLVENTPKQVALVAGMAIAVIGINEIATMLSQQVMTRWSGTVVENINNAATQSALDARYEVHLDPNISRVINGSQATQREWLMNSLNYGAFTTISSSVGLISAIVSCLLTNWSITTVILMLLVLCSLNIVRIGKIRSKLYDLRHKVLGTENETLGDAYSIPGIQDRKTGGKDFLPPLRNYTSEWRKASVRTISLARGAYVPINIVVASMSPLLFLMMALMQMGGLVEQASLTVILAMQAQVGIMAAKLSGVTSGLQFMQDLRDTARGFADMLELEPELAPSDDAVLAPTDPSNRRIRLRGVEFGYPGAAQPVIRDASCKIEPGDFVSVIGVSGEGKSTLAQALAGLLHPQHGEILCGEHYLHALEPEVREGLLAYMGQKAPAFPGSVLEQFKGRWKDATDAEIERVLTTTGLWQELQRKKGVETQASSLSGGQQQRLHFALIDFETRKDGPKFVIVDEGTSDLDLSTERKVVARLRSMAEEGCTVLQVAHRTQAINAATHILALEEGVASLRPLNEVREDPTSLYYRLVVETGATTVE